MNDPSTTTSFFRPTKKPSQTTYSAALFSHGGLRYSWAQAAIIVPFGRRIQRRFEKEEEEEKHSTQKTKNQEEEEDGPPALSKCLAIVGANRMEGRRKERCVIQSDSPPSPRVRGRGGGDEIIRRDRASIRETTGELYTWQKKSNSFADMDHRGKKRRFGQTIRPTQQSSWILRLIESFAILLSF